MDEGRPAPPPWHARPRTLARFVPRLRRRTERRGTAATLGTKAGRGRGRGLPRRRASCDARAVRDAVPRRTRAPPAPRGALGTRDAVTKRDEHADSNAIPQRRPGILSMSPRSRDARRNTQCHRVVWVWPWTGGIPGCPHYAAPTERANDARKRSAARDAITGAVSELRLSRVCHCARSVCDTVPRHRPATPSRDAVLRPSWDAPHCAAHAICTLAPRVPTTGRCLW